MTDRIKSEGIDIVHCPTEEMLADFFTKPLQGALFKKFKRVLMGHAHIGTLKQNTSSTSDQERVGNGLLAGHSKWPEAESDIIERTYSEVVSGKKGGVNG